MTDEKRLHEMMADPGPAPVHDAHGWPTEAEFPVGAIGVDKTGRAWQRGPAGADPDRWAAATCLSGGYGFKYADVLFANDGEPLTMVYTPAADSAGPVSSSASTSGTGDLTDTIDRMLAGTQRLAEEATSAAQYLTRIAEEIREEVEGQRRAVWDALVLASRTASESYSNGIAYAYYLLTGLNGWEIDRRLDAELDSRYGTDRTKGGESRG